MMNTTDYELLAQSRAYDNFVAVPIHWAKKIGFLEAGLLQIFISKHKYYKEKKQLTADGRFFLTVETIKDICGATKDQQKTAMAKLKKYGFVDVKRVGMPAKNYYLLDHKKIVQALDLSQLEESAHQEEQNPPTRSANPANMMAESAPHDVQIPPQLNILLNKGLDNNEIESSPVPSSLTEPNSSDDKTDVTELVANEQVTGVKDHSLNYEQLLQQVHSNIMYDDLQITHAQHLDLVDEFVFVIIDTVMDYSETVRIGDGQKPRSLVTNQLLKLNYNDIEHCVSQLLSVATHIQNKKQYVLTMLYNSKMESSTHMANRLSVAMPHLFSK